MFDFKVLQEAGPDKKEMISWPVIGQFSSIGSLGATPDQWLCDEWLGSLSQCQGVTPTPLHHSKLQLVNTSGSIHIWPLVSFVVTLLESQKVHSSFSIWRHFHRAVSVVRLYILAVTVFLVVVVLSVGAFSVAH